MSIINALLKSSMEEAEVLEETMEPLESDAALMMEEAKQAQAQHSEAVETMLTTYESLDKTAVGLESLLESNNVIAGISLEAIYTQIGITTDNTPSMEQLESLQASLEGGVFDLIRKISNGFTTSMSFIFKSYSSMTKDINELKQRAEHANAHSGKQVTAHNLHRLFVDGKVDPKSVLLGITNTELVTKRIFTDYLSHLETLYKNFSEAYVKVNDLWAMTIQGSAQNNIDMVNAFATHGENLKKAYGDLSHVANHQVEISGGMYFGTLTKNNTELPGLWQKKASLTNSHVNAKQTVDAMQPKDIVKMCDTLLNIVSFIKTRVATVVKELVKMYGSVFEAFEKDRQANPGFFKTFVRLMRINTLTQIYHYLLSGILVSPINDISYHAFGVTRAAVGYGNKCLS